MNPMTPINPEPLNRTMDTFRIAFRIDKSVQHNLTKHNPTTGKHSDLFVGICGAQQLIQLLQVDY